MAKGGAGHCHATSMSWGPRDAGYTSSGGRVCTGSAAISYSYDVASPMGASIAVQHTFLAGDVLHLAPGAGSMSRSDGTGRTSGGGGTFVAINGRATPVVVAGGGSSCDIDMDISSYAGQACVYASSVDTSINVGAAQVGQDGGYPACRGLDPGVEPTCTAPCDFTHTGGYELTAAAKCSRWCTGYCRVRWYWMLRYV